MFLIKCLYFDIHNSRWDRDTSQFTLIKASDLITPDDQLILLREPQFVCFDTAVTVDDTMRYLLNDTMSFNSCNEYACLLAISYHTNDMIFNMFAGTDCTTLVDISQHLELEEFMHTSTQCNTHVQKSLPW